MGGTFATVIISIILIAIVFFAVIKSIPHFKGQGGCCGGSEGEKLIKPRKLEQVVVTKIITIEGMRCDNCRKRVQNALNSMDGVNAKVNAEKKQAEVKLGREIDDAELYKAISDLGYKVVSIENKHSENENE